ncbi:metalloregulator ArsR/SmtB family transcription factor [Streptomyces flaveolus]|uniref:ArsR/SmtB family transcription factor n=1 Tax=Streptomyces flaveolus TaxID=67297 RepID=UPI003443A31D
MPRELAHPDLEAVTLAKVLSALGDPVRLHVMNILADGNEHTRRDFDVQLAQSTFSHHIKVLRDAGLLLQRMEGTRCYVSLRDEARDRFAAVLDSVLATDRAERVK